MSLQEVVTAFQGLSEPDKRFVIGTLGAFATALVVAIAGALFAGRK